MVEAQSLQGIPKVPFCPPLLVMGVNSSGGNWVDGEGLLQPSAPQATATHGFHLANKHWLWD